MFEVKSEVFEGPLDLLLSLIEKRKLLINEVSLAKITDDYIAHIQNATEHSMSDQSNFILIASTLLLIKSKSLLPNLDITEDEQQSIDNLQSQLKIRQLIKAKEPVIAETFGKKVAYAPERNSTNSQIVFAPGKTDLNLLQDLLRKLTTTLPKKQKIPEVTLKKAVSLEEMINKLSQRINQNLEMGFKQFTKEHAGEKVNIIVSFLALLELVKKGTVMADQTHHDEDIKIQTLSTNTPNYI